MEIIGIYFRKIIKSNVVNISESSNEYYQKNYLKSVHKMDLYLAMSKTKIWMDWQIYLDIMC